MRWRRRTTTPAVLIEKAAPPEGKAVATVPAQSIVIDLLIVVVVGPKLPLSRQVITPPESVASWAAWNVAHGAARVHAAPPPAPDTKVCGMACAGLTDSNETVMAARLAESSALAFMATPYFNVNRLVGAPSLLLPVAWLF